MWKACKKYTLENSVANPWPQHSIVLVDGQNGWYVPDKFKFEFIGVFKYVRQQIKLVILIFYKTEIIWNLYYFKNGLGFDNCLEVNSSHNIHLYPRQNVWNWMIVSLLSIACKKGMYGQDCRVPCGACNDDCLPTNGSCPGGCKTGFVGEKCNVRELLTIYFLSINLWKKIRDVWMNSVVLPVANDPPCV